MKLTKEIDSVDDVEFELIESGRLKPSNGGNYVNNKELYQEFIEYTKKKQALFDEFLIQVHSEFQIQSPDELKDSQRKDYQKRIKEFRPPRLTNKIGAAIIQIATRRCNARQFVGYSNNWKEELIANAIMTATIRCHNFNPEKSDNPFAYLTQICNNAILDQLKKEKRQLYIRYKSMEEADGFVGEVDENNMDESELHHMMDSAPSDQRRKYIEDYEASNFTKKEDAKDEPDDGVMSFVD
jgi:hypothetical protein